MRASRGSGTQRRRAAGGAAVRAWRGLAREWPPSVLTTHADPQVAAVAFIRRYNNRARPAPRPGPPPPGANLRGRTRPPRGRRQGAGRPRPGGGDTRDRQCVAAVQDFKQLLLGCCSHPRTPAPLRPPLPPPALTRSPAPPPRLLHPSALPAPHGCQTTTKSRTQKSGGRSEQKGARGSKVSRLTLISVLTQPRSLPPHRPARTPPPPFLASRTPPTCLEPHFLPSFFLLTQRRVLCINLLSC